MTVMPHFASVDLSVPIWTGTLENKAGLLRLVSFLTLVLCIISCQFISVFEAFLLWRNRVGFNDLAFYPRSFPVLRKHFTNSLITAPGIELHCWIFNVVPAGPS